MPARRRAPKGCSLSDTRIPIPILHRIPPSSKLQQNVKLFLREP